MTLEWDLSETPIARSDTAAKPPSENELFAILVGLLLHTGTTYSGLAMGEPLVLSEDEIEQLTLTMEYRVPEIACEFGSSQEMRDRIREFIGIRVTRVHGGSLR